MHLTQRAVAVVQSAGLLQTQGGRAAAEVILALTLLVAITTALAHRHIGGQLLRIAMWASILGLAPVVGTLFIF